MEDAPYQPYSMNQTIKAYSPLAKGGASKISTATPVCKTLCRQYILSYRIQQMREIKRFRQSFLSPTETQGR
jgi:hypothetical protein